MVADASGNMPDSLVIAADQAFLSDGLDNASVVVHGRNSHENQARSLRRRRLIATRKIESVDMIADQPQALLWNPDGLPFEDAARMLGVRRGTVAILGGTEIFGLFLPRYDIFHLSHVAGLRLPFGRAVFPEVPQHSPQAVLSLSGLTQAAERMLDVSRGVTLSTWLRRGVRAV